MSFEVGEYVLRQSGEEVHKSRLVGIARMLRERMLSGAYVLFSLQHLFVLREQS